MSLPESAPSADVLDPPSFGRLAQGVSALTVAEAVRVGVSAALAFYLARRLGAAAFGMWTFAVAVAGYPQALVEAGLTWIGTRDVAAYPAASHALVRRIVCDGRALVVEFHRHVYSTNSSTALNASFAGTMMRPSFSMNEILPVSRAFTAFAIDTVRKVRPAM